MDGYERRTELKKSRIRAAALELFCAYGPDKASINEVAQRAGVAPASIYNYFESKEGLVRDTAINLLESSFQAKEELWRTDLPFPELLRRAVSSKDSFIDTVNLEFIRAAVTNAPEIEKQLDDFYKHRYPDIIGQFLEKGRREGYIRREISAEAAILYLETCQRIFQRPEMLEDKNRDLLKEFYDLVVYGLAGQPVTSELIPDKAE